MNKEIINTHIKDDGTLQIFIGNAILAEISNGKNDKDFIENVLNDMGYKWNDDGTISEMERKDVFLC
jgi:hypothetical protein